MANLKIHICGHPAIHIPDDDCSECIMALNLFKNEVERTYYTKLETYNKTEVNELIADLESVRIEVVDALPSVGEKNVIYFVLQAGQTDVYDEYVWIEGDSDFEKIGSTDIDLSNYYTKTQIDQMLADYLTCETLMDCLEAKGYTEELAVITKPDGTTTRKIVLVKDPPLTYRTVLYTDGTFIINEKSTDIDANIQAHGAETNVYPPLDADHPYAWEGQQYRYWANEIEQIKFAKFGSPVKPTSMRSWYMYCVNLESFDATNLDTSDCVSLRMLFAGATNRDLTKLKSLDLSSFNTSKVTSFKQMCNRCVALETLDISSFNTSSATDMNQMFNRCSALTTLDVSSFNTSNVTDMQGMFTSCSSLLSIDVTGFDTSNVTKMAGMFNGCIGLTSLDVSSFDTSSVTDMDTMFFSCTNLQTIYASEKFDVSAVTTTGNNMFTNDTSLVGGAGTTYVDTPTGRSKTYARIDNPPDAPGYFTAI